MNDIAQAITGIANALVEYLKDSDARYNRKLDKQEKKQLKLSRLIVKRCLELHIDDKELDKLIEKFFEV